MKKGAGQTSALLSSPRCQFLWVPPDLDFFVLLAFQPGLNQT